jgi:hypothetical protein
VGERLEWGEGLKSGEGWSGRRVKLSMRLYDDIHHT